MQETKLDVEVEKNPKKPARKTNPWVGLVRDLVILVIFVFAFRAVVAEANYIPTGSMIPTLEKGDKIIVDKIGLRLGKINRGDILIFFPPDNADLPPKKHPDRYIKRVIGLPGDKVEVKEGEGVFINGQLLYEPYVRYYPSNEAMPGYSWGPITLDDASYFLLGDNRDQSKDSHVWGPCPEENIIGRALFRYWPVYRLGSIEDKDFRDHYFVE